LADIDMRARVDGRAMQGGTKRGEEYPRRAISKWGVVPKWEGIALSEQRQVRLRSEVAQR